jgi:hypothetical protein
VGSILQITEQGGYIECVLHAEEGPLAEYPQYKGVEPDFGSVESSGSGSVVAPKAAEKSSPTPSTTKPKKKHKKHKVKAKKTAVSVSCTLSTGVVLSYLLT